MRIRVSPRATGSTRFRTRSAVKRGNTFISSAQSVKTAKGSRLSALNVVDTMAGKVARSNYQKLEKSATGLTDRLAYLSQKAAEGGKNISTGAKEMVDYYNDTIKNLKQTSGILNQYYYQSLKETAASNRNELEEIGISVGTDGSLTLNKGKLENADAEKIKKVFGEDSDFVKRISAVASRVADNAKVNAQSLSSQYTAAGGLANSYLSRYNYKS